MLRTKTFKATSVIVMALVLLGALVSVANARPSALCPATAQVSSDRLSHIALPEIMRPTPLPTQGIVDFLVDPSDANRIFVWSGSTILRSEDGGCSWEEIFSIAEPTDHPPFISCADAYPLELIVGQCRRIFSVDVGPTPSTHNRIYVQLWSLNSGAGFQAGSSTVIFISEDGGDSWALNTDASSDGLLTTYGIGELTISPSEPNRVYLLRNDFDAGGVGGSQLFASDDAGASWEARKTPGRAQYGQVPKSVVIDPFNSSHLWTSFAPTVADALTLYETLDGGSTWSPLEVPFQQPRDLDIISDPGSPPSLLAVTDKAVFVSANGGSTWSDLPNPEGMHFDYAQFGRNRNYIFTFDDLGGGLVRYDLRRDVATVIWEGGHAGRMTRASSAIYFLDDCTTPRSGCKTLTEYTGRGS